MLNKFLKEYKTEILIFIAAFCARIFFLMILLVLGTSVPDLGSDSHSFLGDMRGMLETGHFININTGRLNSYDMPGYPIFLLIILAVFKKILIVSVIQDFIGGISAVLVYKIGLTWSKKVGILAALFFSFEPAGLLYSNYIATEPLFIFFVLLTVYVLINNIGRFLRGSFFVGALLGMSTMIRPVGEVLIPSIIIFYVLQQKKYLLNTIILFLVGFLMIVGPWSIRNKMFFNTWELSAVASWQFAYAHAPAFYAYNNNISMKEAEDIFKERLLTLTPYKNEVRTGKSGILENSPYMWKVAFDYIGEHPILYAKFHLIKTIPFFISDGARDILYRMRLSGSNVFSISDLLLKGRFNKIWDALTKNVLVLMSVIIGGIFWLAINILMVYGWIISSKQKHAITVLCVGFILTIALVSGGSVSHPRYRYSISPFMFLLAGVGLQTLLGKYKYKTNL